jgi:type IV secretory pathway VirJ component
MDAARIIRPRRRRIGRRAKIALAGVGVTLAAIALALLAWAGFFARDPISYYPGGAKPDVAIVYFSGDMGLHMGIATAVVPALSARQVPVLGVNSPTLFRTHRTRAEVDALVAGAMREAIARTGAKRIVLMGQSFGADMVGTGVADLPADLRARVAAVLLVVPGRDAYFRADPTGIAYLGTPDAKPAEALRTVTWAPVICIHGERESDSACPGLAGGAARVIALPGGHYLAHDDARLVATILSALAPVIPQLQAA